MQVDLVQLQRQSEQIAANARLEERTAALAQFILAPEHVVCDVPSWGGYFARGVPDPRRVICLDPDPKMVNCPGARIMMSSAMSFPIPTASVDRLVSLVGLHHQTPAIRNLFLLEVSRVMRHTGVAVVSEVIDGSPIATFLNEDVDKYSERGHKGTFFAVGGVKAALEGAGLTNVVEQTLPLMWRFDSQAQMASYCKALFAMTRATDTQVLAALHARFTIVEQGGMVCLPWSLLYGVGTKG